MEAKPKNRGGRPRVREPKEGQRITISVRVTPRLKGLLDEAALANGRSLSQEAERLLELAFDPKSRPASGEDIAMVIGGMVRLSEVMMKAGDHFLSSRKPEDVKAAAALKWHAHALLDSLPKSADAKILEEATQQLLDIEKKKAAGK